MSRKRIFVVDDDEMMCEMLKMHLEQNGKHLVTVFNTGEEALEFIYQEPDLVILDYELNSIIPDAMDGQAILEEIKKNNPKIKVIMLSSQNHYGKATQTIMKGAVSYVVKNESAFAEIDKLIKGF